MNGTHSVTLGDGSLTSVSGSGLTIPFGATQFGGEQWTYIFDPQSTNAPQVIAGIPTRAVNLTAPNVAITKHATVNLTGGGDLSAYEWVPGPGGSSDALAPAAPAGVARTPANGIPGLYAILPSTRGQAAPQDAQSADASILAGETVYLSGGDGLAAGTYPLLPARYGLVPGAFLIQIEPSYRSTSPGSIGALADGTPVVAGFLSYGSTGLHQTPGYTGFALYPGSYGGTLAAYTDSLASTFFSAAASSAGAPRPNLPADAGSLSISVSNSLDATGQVLTAAAKGGLAAPIEISASDLFIGTASDAAPAGAVSISGAVLDSWQPGSLLLGGTITPSTVPATAASNSQATSPIAIDVLADTVTVGAGTTLTAGQIVLVANQSIDVQNGAILQSSTATSGTAPGALPSQQAVTLTGSSSNANPGFLAVSDLNWLIPLRVNGAVPAGAGTVSVETGATIASRGSLTIDSLGEATLNGTFSGSGAEWSLGSSSLGIGTAPAGANADSMSIDGRLLATLGAAGAVRLASTGAIDILSPVTLGVNPSGSPTLNSLTLKASTLNNFTGSGATAGSTATEFGAQTLTLEGAGASATNTPAAAGPAGAALSLVAGELNVGPNAVTADALDVGTNMLAVNGFAATHARVTGAVIGQGSEALNVGGDLTIAASGVTAATAANTAIDATGTLSVLSAGTGKLPQLLGGALSLSGHERHYRRTHRGPRWKRHLDGKQ